MTANRLDWADVARGGAMMLVVLAHTLQLMEIQGWQLGWLDTLNLYLTAIRMPLFFLVAGIFGARAINRSWAGLWRSRLALLVYVYVLWMIIRSVWFSFVPWPLGDTPPWLALALAPVWPTNGLWFLFALVLYLVIGRATARWPVWAPLVLSGLLAVAAAADLVPTAGNAVWRSVALYWFFFVLGSRLSDVWRTVAAASNIPLFIAALVAVPPGVLLFSLVPAVLSGLARVLLSVVCVAACLIIASTMAKVGWLAAPFVYVGRRTLPIYVTHTLLLAVIVPLVPLGSAPAVVIAVACTVLAVLLSLGLYALLGPLGGVYNLPRPLARRWSERQTATEV